MLPLALLSFAGCLAYKVNAWTGFHDVESAFDSSEEQYSMRDSEGFAHFQQ